MTAAVYIQAEQTDGQTKMNSILSLSYFMKSGTKMTDPIKLISLLDSSIYSRTSCDKRKRKCIYTRNLTKFFYFS